MTSWIHGKIEVAVARNDSKFTLNLPLQLGVQNNAKIEQVFQTNLCANRLLDDAKDTQNLCNCNDDFRI